MNRTYRLVWNRALRIMQVASELARNPGDAISRASVKPVGLRSQRLPLAILLALGFSTHAHAQSAITLNVGSASDLQTAISTIDSNPASAYILNFTSSVTLSGATALPQINSQSTVTINGNGMTLNGSGAAEGFYVTSGSVSISQLNINNMRAQGETSLVGGGGAGLGGGVFVGSTATVTLTNVNFSGNAASGGDSSGNVNNIGSGFVGGRENGRFGTGGADGPAASGSDPTGGPGGAGSFGAGGGLGGSPNYSLPAGNGGAGGAGGFGAGGGGGGSAQSTDGSLGLGGRGGIGGFGGGNGSAAGNISTAGFTSSVGGGGGGGGMGGAIFVQNGGVLVINGSLGISGSAVNGGTGTFGGGNGSAFGSGIFLQGNGSLTFAPDTGNIQTINDDIADQTGSGGTGANAGTYALIKNAAGTLVLNGNNSYTGGTVVNAGTLSIASDNNLGATSGALTLNGGTLQVTAATTLFRNIDIIGNANLDAAGALRLEGRIDGAGALTVNNSGNTTFANALGATTPLTSLNIDATGSTTLGGNVTTSGAQTYNDAVTLAVDVVATSTGNGAIDFASTVDGAHNLMANTSGGITFAGSVGGTTALSSLSTNSGSFSANAMNIRGPLSVTTTTSGITQSGAFVVSGASNFNAGANAIVLSNAGNNFTGAVTASGSNVVIDNAGALNVASITANGGDINLASAGNLTLGSAITSNTLELEVTGNIAQTNGVVTTGTLSGSSTGSVPLGGVNQISSLGNFTATGYFGLTDGVPLTINGTLAAANVVLYDTADIVVTGAINATGSTSIVNNTVLQVGTGGNTGSISGNLVDDGTLVFNRSDSPSYSGLFSGNGKLVQNGSGTLTLTGANNYSGGTAINAGTLQIGDGSAASTIAGNVLDNATLAFDTGANLRFAGVLSGTGQLAQIGKFSLTLDGNSSGFAGTTEVRSGALIVGSAAGNGAALGGNVAVDAGATLGGHGSIGGNIDLSSGAHLAPGDSIGTLTVGGNASFAQGSVLDDEFGAPGANLATFGTGDSVKVGGNLALAGAVLNVTDLGGFGPGLYNLFSYAGSLTETNGGIMLGSTPSGNGALVIQTLTANRQINLLNAAGLTLNFWNGNGLASATQAGGGSGIWATTSPAWTNATGSVSAPMVPQPGFAIFGGAPGTVTIDNTAGNVIAAGLQFASNGYTLSGDTLTLVGSNGAAPIIRVGDGSSAGAGYTTTVNNVIAGTDGLTKSDLGTLVLTAANTYSGDTTINGGVLSVSSDANLGAASNALALDGGTLQITGTTFNSTARTLTLGSAGGGFSIADAGNTFTVAQSLGGSGGLSKLGAGTLVLTGNNTYSGGTTVSAGTLQGDSGSLQGNIADNAALVFNQTSDGIYTAVLSGSGTLTKAGAGTLTLNASNSLSGAATVTTGKLVVGDDSHAGASLDGMVTVASGASLGGIGTIGGLNLAGTVAPGNSIGTLHVTGDVTFQPGSSYQIDAAPNGSSDQIAAGGKVSILGGSAVVLAQTGTWAPSTNYTILTAAGGVTGQFASASSSLTFLDPVLGYTANAVNLSLQRNDISFVSVAQTPNQKAVAATADGFGFGDPVYSALTTLDGPTVRHAFDQLSGVIYPSSSTALIDDSRYIRDAINRHLLGLDNAGAQGATAEGVSVWTSAWGHGGHDNDDTNAASVQINGSGVLVGADSPLGTDARLGAVLGHGQNSIQSNSVGSSEHVLGDHAGLYGSSMFGSFVLRAGAVYSWQQIRSNRAVAFGSYSDWVTGAYDAQTTQVYVEGGYQFNVSPGQQLEPFVNVARVRVHDNTVQEGGGDAALAVTANSTSVNTGTLGLRDTFALDAAGGIHAHASIGWQQAWGDLTPVSTMSFLAGGDSFAIAGIPVAHHALSTDLGIEFMLAKNVSVDASYLGQFASGVQDQGARMSLHVTF